MGRRAPVLSDLDTVGHPASKEMLRDEHDDAKDMAHANDDFQPAIGHFAPIRLRFTR